MNKQIIILLSIICLTINAYGQPRQTINPHVKAVNTKLAENWNKYITNNPITINILKQIEVQTLSYAQYKQRVDDYQNFCVSQNKATGVKTEYNGALTKQQQATYELERARLNSMHEDLSRNFAQLESMRVQYFNVNRTSVEKYLSTNKLETLSAGIK